MVFNLEGMEELKNNIEVNNVEVAERIVVKRIELDKLKEHEYNFYDISNVDSLAEEIKIMKGDLLNPIKVKKDNTIISGHRRYNAFKQLAEHDDRFKTIPVIYIDEFNTEEEELLYLMNENNQRIKSSEEINEEIMLKKELYVSLKNNGVESYQNVNINKLLADEFNKSVSSIKRAVSGNKPAKAVKSNAVLSVEKGMREILKTEVQLTGESKGYLKIKYESPENLNDILESLSIMAKLEQED